MTAVGGSGSRLRLLFAGTPEAAVPSLRALLDSRHEVVAVLTRPDAPAGRGRRMVRSPVGALADEAGIPVLTPRRLSEPGFLDTLRTLSPDCGVIVAYGALVPRAALDVPRLRVGQPALLAPAGLARRRARAGRAAARRRDHRCRDLPAGGGPRHRAPCTGVVTEAVATTDTAGDLLGRLSVSGAALLAATVDGLADGTVVARPQPAEGVSHAPKVTVDDARVDWAEPAVAVDRLVRSVTPEPGAWTTFRGERLGLGPVRPADAAGVPELKPGELHAEKRRVLVGTATAPVELGEVRPVGRRPMPAPDWARGVRITSGEVLA